MPNILTHGLITAEVFDTQDPQLMLASALSDFSGMYHDQTGEAAFHKGDIRPKEAARLVSFNGATDAVFDRLPLRGWLVKTLITDIVQHAPDIKGHSASACARVGLDILVDGALLRVQEPRQVKTAEALRDFAQFDNLVGMGLTMDFAHLISDYFKSERYEHYTDPVFVADIMYKRFEKRAARRARTGRLISLAFPREAVEDLAAIYETQLQRLQGYGSLLVDLTAHKLKQNAVAQNQG